MKYLLILALCCSSVSFAQKGSLKEAVQAFDIALATKDTIALKQVLHDNLSYGHSNGWIETKKELIADLFNGKITYNKVESRDVKIMEHKGWANVRMTTEIKYVMDGKEGGLTMHVLQVWMKKGTSWKMVSRQSTKISG